MFDTEKKRKGAIDDLKNLQTNPGWDVVVQIAKANIEDLKDLIVDNPYDYDKHELDLLRKKIEAYKDVINTPQRFIKKLSGDSFEGQKSYDPYFNAEDFMTPAEKSKQKASEVDKDNQTI